MLALSAWPLSYQQSLTEAQGTPPPAPRASGGSCTGTPCGRVTEEPGGSLPAWTTLGRQNVSLQHQGRLWAFPPLSLLFPFFFLICPLTVSSLNLINLSEGAPGECGTEVGVIAECAERRGWELWEARGHWHGGIGPGAAEFWSGPAWQACAPPTAWS